jgi:hypothetical protein
MCGFFLSGVWCVSHQQYWQMGFSHRIRTSSSLSSKPTSDSSKGGSSLRLDRRKISWLRSSSHCEYLLTANRNSGESKGIVSFRSDHVAFPLPGRHSARHLLWTRGALLGVVFDLVGHDCAQAKLDYCQDPRFQRCNLFATDLENAPQRVFHVMQGNWGEICKNSSSCKTDDAGESRIVTFGDACSSRWVPDVLPP